MVCGMGLLCGVWVDLVSASYLCWVVLIVCWIDCVLFCVAVFWLLGVGKGLLYFVAGFMVWLRGFLVCCERWLRGAC